MNLNQSAHGDREYAHIIARLRKPCKTVIGYWKDSNTQDHIAVWERVCAGWTDAHDCLILRFGDQMNNVAVTDGDNYGNSNKYWTVNEQVLFNLSNLFCGYNPNRVWNVIPFAGAGVSRSMTYNRYAMDFSAGIQSSWKVSKLVNVYVEGGLISMEVVP